MSFEKIGQKGESHEGITDSLRSAIIVRGEEVLLSAEGKMRDYNEINGVYRGIHPNAQILIYGTSRYVELFKEAIMRVVINGARADMGRGESMRPVMLAEITHAISSTWPHIPIEPQELPFVENPNYGFDDKARLPYMPDFESIKKADDPRTQAFAEAYYVVQKFMAGIRDDMLGGSDLLGKPYTWETFQAEHTQAADGSRE